MCREGEGATKQNVPIPRTMKRPSTFVVKERLNLLGKPTIVHISFLSAIQLLIDLKNNVILGKKVIPRRNCTPPKNQNAPQNNP